MERQRRKHLSPVAGIRETFMRRRGEVWPGFWAVSSIWIYGTYGEGILGERNCLNKSTEAGKSKVLF